MKLRDLFETEEKNMIGLESLLGVYTTFDVNHRVNLFPSSEDELIEAGFDDYAQI